MSCLFGHFFSRQENRLTYSRKNQEKIQSNFRVGHFSRLEDVEWMRTVSCHHLIEIYFNERSQPHAKLFKLQFNRNMDASVGTRYIESFVSSSSALFSISYFFFSIESKDKNIRKAFHRCNVHSLMHSSDAEEKVNAASYGLFCNK